MSKKLPHQRTEQLKPGSWKVLFHTSRAEEVETIFAFLIGACEIEQKQSYKFYARFRYCERRDESLFFCYRANILPIIK